MEKKETSFKDLAIGVIVGGCLIGLAVFWMDYQKLKNFAVNHSHTTVPQHSHAPQTLPPAPPTEEPKEKEPEDASEE
jgi:hypothetical protein